jgi:hypothetical protein
LVAEGGDRVGIEGGICSWNWHHDADRTVEGVEGEDLIDLTPLIRLGEVEQAAIASEREINGHAVVRKSPCGDKLKIR